MSPSFHSLLTIAIIFLVTIFSANADYKLTNYGLHDVQGTLAAIGDFNSDKQADLFVVTFEDGLYRVNLYMWTKDGDRRYKLHPFTYPITSVDPIYSVIVGDFNYDGRLDVLITGPRLTQDSTPVTNPFDLAQTTPVQDSVTRKEFFAHIFFGRINEILNKDPFQITPRPVGQVSSMSISGNLTPDLFGMYFNEKTETYERGLWSFIPDAKTSNSLPNPLAFTHTFVQIDPQTGAKNPSLTTTTHPFLAQGFAPILADFDGDCAADLIIVSSKTSPEKQKYPGLDPTGSTTPYDPSVLQYDDEKQIEIWIFDRDAPITNKFPFTLHTTLPAQLGMLQPAVGDFNKDGALDIVIPYCYPYATCGDKNSVEIYYNTQKGMCSSISLSSGCRSTTSLCVSDPNWSISYPGKQIDETPQPNPSLALYDQVPTIALTTASATATTSTTTTTTTTAAAADNNNNNSNDDDDTDDDDESGPSPSYYSQFKITTTRPSLFENGKLTFSMPHLGQDLSILNPPFRLTVLDINNDGDLDVAFIAKRAGPGSGDNDSTTFAMALGTAQCKSSTCSEYQHDTKLYTFANFNLPNLHFISKTGLNQNLGTIDFGNSGSIDIILVKFPDGFAPPVGQWNLPTPDASDGTPTVYAQLLNKARILPTQNNFYGDSYFLTLLGGNGMCHSWCNGFEFPSPKPYGVSLSGPVFKFTVTALNGKKSPRIFIQQPQTAYSPLSPPYQVVGLGRTSNYIEELFMGIPTTKAHVKADNSQLFQAMIPNSQILVFPYPVNKPSSWRIELFISFTQRLLAVFIAFVVTTTACCLVILALHLREKWAEEKLKKQRQRLFAF